MKWQSLLQAHRPTCQPLMSDDYKLCFLAGLPLSIHVYSTQSSLLVSSLPLPDSQNRRSKLVKILRHPTSPQQLIILVSSAGSVYVFDFHSNSIKATYHTGLVTSHAEIRPPSSSSSLSSIDPSSRSDSSFTIFLATKKVIQTSTKPHLVRFNNSHRRPKNRQQSIIYAIQLNSSPSSEETQDPTDSPEELIQKRILLKLDPISTFSLSPCGNWLGIVTGLNLWIIRIKEANLFEDPDKKKCDIESVHLSTPEKITTITFPPRAHADHSPADSNTISIVPCDFFATGSTSGKIALWHALSEAQWSRFTELTARRPDIALPCPTSVSQWHSHAVADLTFTPNGSHLLSGGEEAVLVLWRLDDFSGIGFDSKTFLPRLGTQISTISLIKTFDDFNQPNALVTGNDGVIMIVNISSMSISKTLKLPRMYQLPPVYKTSTDPILLPICSGSNPGEKKPYGNLLLQSSHPCGLQILDGGTGNVLDEIFVRPKNIVSRRRARQIVEPKLLFVALGGIHDQYLGTIDSWVDEERGFTPEITLKLWERDDGNSNRFQVIARVENPHEDSQITSLKLTTDLVPKLVTTSIDGTIKIWTSSSGSNDNLNIVPNAMTSATTSLGKIKKSSHEAFENLKSIKLKFKNYGILKSRISKDNSILILLHRHPNQNIISIWDLIHLKFLSSFILDSPSFKLNYLLKFDNSKQKQNRKLKNFHVNHIDFLGDKNQFIIVLGNLGCGLFDLLTGSEIGFWKCKPRFLVKTTDETKVVIIYEKRIAANEELLAKADDHQENSLKQSHKQKIDANESNQNDFSDKKTDATENDRKKNSKKQVVTKNVKEKKVTMMAVVDVLERKTIMNHRIREVISGMFISTGRNHEDSPSSMQTGHSPEPLTKEEVLDGLVLITKSAGLIRAGSEIKENDYYLLANRTSEIERQVGISSGLPFQEIFKNDCRKPLEIDSAYRFQADHRTQARGNFELDRQNLNQDHELNIEIENFINLSPHLVPPSRLIWSKLIQPKRPRKTMPGSNGDNNGVLSTEEKEKADTQDQMDIADNVHHHLDQPSGSSMPSLNPSTTLHSSDVDNLNVDRHPPSVPHLADFNRRLLANIDSRNLSAFQLLDID